MLFSKIAFSPIVKTIFLFIWQMSSALQSEAAAENAAASYAEAKAEIQRAWFRSSFLWCPPQGRPCAGTHKGRRQDEGRRDSSDC